MKLSDLIGNGDRLRQLMRSAQAGRIVHAFVLSGPRGTGKHTAAKLLIQGMFCTGTEPPCGVCPACRRVWEGTHPDVHGVDVPPDKKEISVDQIRDLIDRVSVRPYEGERHAVIIAHADRMSESAENALLKTLESPPVETTFFLLSEGAMLPTILSRCQRVRLRALSAEEVELALTARGVDPLRARELAGLSGGSVGRALEIDQDKGYFDLRARALQALRMVKGPEDVLGAVSLLAKDKDRAEAVLEIFEGVARDRMAVQNGAEPFSRSNEAVPAFDGAGMLMALDEVRRRMGVNISWQNALEHLLSTYAARERTGG